MSKMVRLFIEDEVLVRARDDSYPGIVGWWKEKFDRDFHEDWKAAARTEEDQGDCFARTLSPLEEIELRVVLSVDGYEVFGDRDRYVAHEIRQGRCPFGNLRPGQSMVQCPSGFPGCGCADELMVNPHLVEKK